MEIGKSPVAGALRAQPRRAWPGMEIGKSPANRRAPRPAAAGLARHGNREVPREPVRFAPDRGGLGPAWGAEVVSSNIVGYEKVNLVSGFNMVGVQFVNVGTKSAKDLSSATQLDSSMSGFDEDGNYASKIKVWDGENYATFGWSGSSGTEYLEDATLDNKWLNADYEETDDTMDKGAAAWIIAEKAGTMTVSGEVPSSPTITMNLVSGFNMVANPYPGTVKVADFGVLDSTFAGFDEDGNYASKIKVWDGENYATFGWSGSSGTEYLEDATLDNKWLNADYEETDDTVDFGHGVWLIAEKAGTITFTSPTQGE